MHWTGLTFKGVHDKAGHSDIIKTLHLVRDCLLWPEKHNIWRLLHWKQKEQVRLLKCIWTVCCLANFVYSLFNGKRFRWWDGRVGPHSIPLILTTSVKYGKLPAMYNCVKYVYFCIAVSFDLMVSVDFKTSGRCFLKGEVCS